MLSHEQHSLLRGKQITPALDQHSEASPAGFVLCVEVGVLREFMLELRPRRAIDDEAFGTGFQVVAFEESLKLRLDVSYKALVGCDDPIEDVGGAGLQNAPDLMRRLTSAAKADDLIVVLEDGHRSAKLKAAG